MLKNIYFDRDITSEYFDCIFRLHRSGNNLASLLFFIGCLLRHFRSLIYDNEPELHHHWLDVREQQRKQWSLDHIL